jgi:DNA-directed RNA polymerase specialized sigma24 family protein
MEAMPYLPDRASDMLGKLMLEEQMDALRALMAQLGESCRNILWDALYFGFRPAEIAEKYGLKNAETVLSQKSRCLKKLRSMAGAMNNER